MTGLCVQGSPGSVVGRYLVSGRSVAAGQLILREEAFTTGPRQSSTLVCVQCLHRMGEMHLCTR